MPLDDARPAALVLVPTRELAVQVTEEIESLADSARAVGRRGLRRRADPSRGERGPRRARHRRDARPPPGPHRPPPARPRRGRDPRPRRGRPHARHGLQAAGRPDRQAASARPADDVLLRDARRRGGRAGARIHAVSPPGSRRSCSPSTRPARSTTSSSPVTPDTKVDTLIELLEAERGLALVFVRTKRGADRLARKLEQRGDQGPRDARRRQPGPASASAQAVRERPGRRRSSQPTSPPAGSTSTT